jgi:streptogramin lyase
VKGVETIAGRAGEAGSQDGVGAAARFNSPRGLASGPDGSVYIADSGNHAIRRIAPDGTVTTIAGELGVPGSDDGVARRAHLNTPSGIDVNAKGEIFIADTGNHAIRLITTDGRLVTIAGTPGVPGFADGYATSAKFAGPVGLRIAPDGSLLIADTSNNAIRRYSVVSTPQNRRRSVRH